LAGQSDRHTNKHEENMTIKAATICREDGQPAPVAPLRDRRYFSGIDEERVWLSFVATGQDVL